MKIINKQNVENFAKKHGIVYLDLKNDYAFKRVFGTEGQEDALLKLIDSILPEKHIQSVVLGSQEQMGDRKKSKRSIYDIHCTTDDGSNITVEMQVAVKSDFNDRMLYYSTFPIRNQLASSEDSYYLNPVYVISIVDFIMPNVEQNDSVINEYMLINRRSLKGVLTDALHCVTVELPKMTKSLGELENDTDRMLYLFRNLDGMNTIPEEMRGMGLEKIFDCAKFANMTEREQYDYIMKFKADMDRRSERRTAIEMGLAEGREKGLAEGREKGLAEGRAEGREAGIDESRRAIAKSLLADGMAIPLVAKHTGLSAEVLAKL